MDKSLKGISARGSRQAGVLKNVVIMTGLVVLTSGMVSAAETITYTYDARGRVVGVIRTGTVNNNVQTTYQYDKANNKKDKTTTGSTNPPPP